MPTQEIESRLRLFSWLAAIGGLIVLAMVVLLMIVILLFSFRISESAKKVEDAVEATTQTICALQDNARAQLIASNAFIEENPNGIPGIPITTIKQSRDRQRAFLNALMRGGVDCP